MNKEIWQPVIGFEGRYEVSSLGRVRSIDHYTRSNNRWGPYTVRFRGKVLRPRLSGGYQSVTLSLSGQTVQKNVHVLVAQAFIGPRPLDQVVCHRDGDKSNCAETNLYYGTHKDNSLDAINHGHQPRGERQGSSKLTEQNVREIRGLIKTNSQRKLAAQFGVCQTTIRIVAKGQGWRHVTPLGDAALRRDVRQIDLAERTDLS